MSWVRLGYRIFDLPNVRLGTYFRQPNLPNNPLGQGNPSGQPYRTGTLSIRNYYFNYYFKVIFYFLAFLGISRPFPSVSRRDHGTGNGSLCPVPISRRDGIPTWKTRPFPSRGEDYLNVLVPS